MRVITAILQLVISVGDNLFSFLYATVTIKVSSWHNEVTQPVVAKAGNHLVVYTIAKSHLKTANQRKHLL